VVSDVAGTSTVVLPRVSHNRTVDADLNFGAQLFASSRAGEFHGLSDVVYVAPLAGGQDLQTGPLEWRRRRRHELDSTGCPKAMWRAGSGAPPAVVRVRADLSWTFRRAGLPRPGGA
jgi:hypothetical protein